MNRRFGTLVASAVGICATLALVSAQSRTDTSIPAMPGLLVATDAGHRLHVWCTGQGTPAVVLLNGGGSFSIDWARIQPQIAAKTRVCSYDRAGYAWSEPGTAPRSLGTSAAELHQVLTRAEVRPPYILVATSVGGLIARVFAHVYQGEVAGVVLADATTWGMRRLDPVAVPDDLLKDLDVRAEEEPVLENAISSDWKAARAWAGSRLPADVMTLEISNLREPDRVLNAITAEHSFPLGDAPLVVISAGRIPWNEETRATFGSYAAAQRAHIADQARLTGLSRNSRLVVARGSFHAVQFYEPAVLISAVLQVLAATEASSTALHGPPTGR